LTWGGRLFRFGRIARHYENARSYEDAEKYYIRAGIPGSAVEMYTRVDKWEQAHKVAVGYMTDQVHTHARTDGRMRCSIGRRRQSYTHEACSF
jgi:hypothetical protein